MVLPDRLIPAFRPEHRNEVAPGGWTAQARVLLYLRALRIPPEKGLQYASDAFSRARTDFPGKDSVSATMTCLRAALGADGLLPETDPDFTGFLCCREMDRQRSAPLHISPCEAGHSFRTLALPPIRRRSMPAAVLNRTPWQGVTRTLWDRALRWSILLSCTQLSSAVWLLCFLGLIFWRA